MSEGVLVMAHGTPRSLDDVARFYTEIRRGNPPTDAQTGELRERYGAIGGTSPLMDITAAQAGGLANALQLRARGHYVVELGAKFSDPRIELAAARLAASSPSQVIGIVLAPHYSDPSIGDYARRARVALRDDIPLEMIDHWHTEPALIAMLSDRVMKAISETGSPDAHVIFTAHSLPVASAGKYVAQVDETAREVARRSGNINWSVAWQSAGRAGGDWLGPDVSDAILCVGEEGSKAVVICPVGFVSDHLEVLYDLDVVARRTAEEAGMHFARTRSLNADPRLCGLLADVVVRRSEQATT